MDIYSIILIVIWTPVVLLTLVLTVGVIKLGFDIHPLKNIIDACVEVLKW